MLSKDEILYWSKKYDLEEDLYNQGEEIELGNKFRKNGYVLKTDLEEIVKWKFQNSLIGRRNRILKFIGTEENLNIKKITKNCFSIDDDYIKISLLNSINGIGNSLSSVILTFHNPQNYGILDIHSWRTLFGKESSDIFSNKRKLIMFFDKIRDISKRNNLECRIVEKAIFKMDLEKNK
jgi:hypothetical protein